MARCPRRIACSRRRLRSAPGRPRDAGARRRGRLPGRRCDRGTPGERAPTRAWRAARTHRRTAFPPRWSIPRTHRVTPRGSGTTSATARARWAGCRARARPRRSRALRRRRAAGWWRCAARTRRSRARRSSSRSAGSSTAARSRRSRGASILVTAARTSDKDAAKLFDALLRRRERQQRRERARGRVRGARRVPRPGAPGAGAAARWIASGAREPRTPGPVRRRSRTTSTRPRRSPGSRPKSTPSTPACRPSSSELLAALGERRVHGARARAVRRVVRGARRQASTRGPRVSRSAREDRPVSRVAGSAERRSMRSCHV